MLRTIEQKIESLFEGAFGRAFRRNVQPVELARKLAKEMDDYKMVSVSQIYAPNEYVVYLSPKDRDQFESYEPALVKELEEYLAEHGRREGYQLLSARRCPSDGRGPRGRPLRHLEPDDPARAPRRARRARCRAGRDAHLPRGTVRDGGRLLPRSSGWRPSLRRSRSTARSTGSRSRSWSSAGRRTATSASPTRTSRGGTRRFARKGTTFWIVDLDSTNGVAVNGRALKRAKLDDEDRITLGSSELVFRRPR